MRRGLVQLLGRSGWFPLGWQNLVFTFFHPPDVLCRSWSELHLTKPRKRIKLVMSLGYELSLSLVSRGALLWPPLFSPASPSPRHAVLPSKRFLQLVIKP